MFGYEEIKSLILFIPDKQTYTTSNQSAEDTG